MAKIISDLGIEVSTRYAEDRERYDETIVKESRAIPVQTQIEVTAPIYSMELDLLFGVDQRNIPWADLPPPENFYAQKRRLFTDQLIPSLGTSEKRDSQLERIMLMSKTAPSGKELSWEEKIESSGKEKEINAIKNLFTAVETLTRYIVEFKSLSGQYQKG